MNAVIDKPRSKAAVKSANTIQAELAKLHAKFETVFDKLEIAYEASDTGSHEEIVVDHIAHDTLDGAISPLRKDNLTQADVYKAYCDIFAPLACLKGAVALSKGTVVHHTLIEAFDLLDAVHEELDSALPFAKMLPAATDSEAADFIRGRDLATRMIDDGHARGQEKECYRFNRDDGVAQYNFVNDYLWDVLQQPSLRLGFTAVLSNFIGCGGEVIDTSFFEGLTLAETQAGAPGADGTRTSGGESDDAPTPATSAPQNDSDFDPYGTMLQAKDVMGAAVSDEGSDVLWGLRNLVNTTAETVTAALEEAKCNGDSWDKQLNLASCSLAGTLAVLTALNDHDGLDNPMLYAAETLLMLTKKRLDCYHGALVRGRDQ